MGTLSVVAKNKNGFTKICSGKDMINVTIPDSVTFIKEQAFYCCKQLESVVIPDGVTSIGERAFGTCKNLKNVAMSQGVTSIGKYAFAGCEGLESITIPDSVKSIGEWSFQGCTSLKSITIPDSVTIIRDMVFCGCTSLKSITIPDSVTIIGECAFSECTSLESITIPNSVISIEDDAFGGCKNLKSVAIPNSVISIGEMAFCRCENLKSVIIPGSVTTIGEDVFWGCTKLESLIGVPGSYAEKWAEENNIPFITQNSISNKTQKVEPSPQPSVILREKSLVPQRAGENSEAMLKEFSEIGNNVSVSHSQKFIPFQESMKIGTHHITEGVQRIEILNMWTVDVPQGYVFSLDSKYTGMSIGGEIRPLVVMIDTEYSDFLYPYQSEINFVVFATRQVGFNGQPLNSLNSRGIITQMNESIKRSTKNYKSIVETELISVQYVTVEHRKNESEFNISIFTQDTWFLAQFLFNEPALGKDERVKMVEDWMKTIEPLQNTSCQILKNSKINAPHALIAQKFSTVSPSKNLYLHYDMLQNQKHGVLSRFAEVSINDSGTEFSCLDLDTLVEEDEHLEKVTFAADADRCNYRCHKIALEMSRVFRVAPKAFNYQQDREGEIRDKTMKRAYNFSALRSFAWTLGAYQEIEGLDAQQISIDVLLQLGEFVKSRDWLNYTDKSHFNGLCDGGDLHMFYLPDKTTPYLVKENVVDKNNVASLDNLRNDLSSLEPIMRQIHEHLYLTRDRSQQLSTPLSDVLYAWCVLALAAEKAFFTEDGPMNCGYSQYND